MNTFKTEFSNPRMFLDKIILQFPSSCLNGEHYRAYQKGVVTILRFGNTCQLVIHDEVLRYYELPAQACFSVLWSLACNGIFNNATVSVIFQAYVDVLAGRYPWVADNSYLLPGFKFVVLELTLDLPGIANLGRFDFQKFQPFHETTFYSKDFKTKRRGSESGRPGQSKGRQSSFFKAYRKDLQIHLPYPLYRMEWTYSGKYRHYLTSDILYKSFRGIYKALLPSLAKLSIELGLLDSINFNPSAFLTQNSLLGKVLKDISGFKKPGKAIFGGAY